MGFIHGHGHQLGGIEQFVEQLSGGLRLQPLRGEIKQPQLVLAQPLMQGAAVLRRQPPMQAGRWDATALQLTHLVLHQHHQR